MKKKNPRKELAEKLYKDPRSDTFANKTRSLIKAGYSPSYVKTDLGKLLVDVNFTDTDYANFKTFTRLVPQIDLLMRKKMDEMSESDTISAKDFANLINLLEKLAKLSGLMKQVIEKTERIIKIEIPKEVVEAEYERRREK